MMSEEENWYDGRGSSGGVKTRGQKTRRVWESSPNTAGMVAVTPADIKRRSTKKLHGKSCDH